MGIATVANTAEVLANRRPSQDTKEPPTLDTAAVLSPSQRPPLPSITSSLSRSSATQLWVTYQGARNPEQNLDNTPSVDNKSKSDLHVSLSEGTSGIEVLDFEQALKIGPLSTSSSDSAIEKPTDNATLPAAEAPAAQVRVEPRKPEIVLGLTSALAVAGNVGSGPASPRFQLPDPTKQPPENKPSGVQRLTNALGLGWVVDKSGRTKTTQPSIVPNVPSSESIISHTETLKPSPSERRRSDPAAPIRLLVDKAGGRMDGHENSSHGSRASFAWNFSTSSKAGSVKH